MASHTINCTRCGAEFTTASWRAWKRGLCDHCSLKKMLDSIQQLHAHSGPYYERWKTNLRRSLRRI